MLRRVLRPSAFTLVETLTAMAILGVAILFFQIVLRTTWFAYQDRILRANLWQEANEIAEKVTDDGRLARQVDIAASNGAQSATFIDKDDNVFATYTMTTGGELQVARAGGNPDVLTTHLDNMQSFFQKDGKSLILNLALQDKNFSRNVLVKTSLDVFPRN